MHNLTLNSGWAVNFNGDFSGDVHVVRPDGSSFSMPFYVMEEAVGEKVRRERISYLEQAKARDLLK